MMKWLGTHSDKLALTASIIAAISAGLGGVFGHDWFAGVAAGIALLGIFPAKMAADAKNQQIRDGEERVRAVEEQASRAEEQGNTALGAALAASSNGPPLW